MSLSIQALRTAVAGLTVLSTLSVHATEIAFCTDAGGFTIELNEELAPRHAASFLRYVDGGHYSGTVFHRVIAGFMIQGGGYDASFAERPTHEAIENESRNGLSNVRGTIAAARTNDPHSATAQFFINVVDNERLDGDPADWGYTVFGRVAAGMDSIDAIAARPTGAGGPFPSDVPTPLVVIHSAARIDRDALAALPAGADAASNLRTRVRDSAAALDHSATLESMGHYRSTCAPLETDLLLAEATAAAALGRADRTRFALDQYFERAPADDAAYRQAVELYAKVAPGKHPAGLRQFGGCRAPSAPDVPDGSVEDLAGMLAGQASVQTFMSQSNAYLECLDQIIDDDRIEAAHRQAAVTEYNRIVDVTQNLGSQFNEQVRAFRARQ